MFSQDEIDWDGEKKYSRIVYRTWWMVAVNLLLKILQPCTKSPFLVNVESEIDENGNPHFCRYCISKTPFISGYFKRIASSFISAQDFERINHAANNH